MRMRKRRGIMRTSTETICLECKQCGNLVETTSNVKAITCSYCVAKMAAPPPAPKEKSLNPRGWQFRKHYVAPDGRQYVYGREVNEISTGSS
jgi:DNA-directed RNA polymerase subunit RPC12/RpoP